MASTHLCGDVSQGPIGVEASREADIRAIWPISIASTMWSARPVVLQVRAGRRRPSFVFDELLTGYALAEDEDFSYRLSRLGRMRYVPSISVWHEKHGVRDRRAVDKKLVLNRTYLFTKNFPQTTLARVQFGLLLATLLPHRLLNMEWDGARGLLEGYRELWRRRKLLDDPSSFIRGTRAPAEVDAASGDERVSASGEGKSVRNET